MTPTVQHSVYRLFDAEGVLLYIGRTDNLHRRLVEHQSVQPWSSEIAEVRARLYPTRMEAARAERVAINSEGAKYNMAAGDKARRNMEMVERLLDRNLDVTLREWRAEGQSFGKIVTTLQRFEVFVSREQVRRWCQELEIPTTRAKADA